MLLRAVLGDLLDLVLPRTCAGCGRAGPPLCRSCRPDEPPLHVWSGGLDVAAAGAYEGPLRAAVIAYKERRRHDLAAQLGRLLGAAARDVADGGVLVPVPSTAAAARSRGGDHVLRLARIAARDCGRPVVQALSFARAVADSVGLDRAERAANLREAMVARPSADGRAAVIVDDVVTSGATLREARRALTAAGWTVVAAATVASTPRHAGRPATSGTVRPSGLPWE